MRPQRRTVVVGCVAISLLGLARQVRGSDNLVFVPLAPCRVIDTRVSGAGGPLVAGTPRSFVLRGPTINYQNPTPFPNQGGSTTGCGIPDLALGVGIRENIAKAVAINIVAVSPAGAGDLRAWAANQSVPLASVINYAAVTGLNLANGIVVPMCDEASPTPCSGGDISFQADVNGAFLVVDVVGYFHAGSPRILTNTALGRLALGSTTVGIDNTAVGTYAMSLNTTGSYNTAIGTRALRYQTSGSVNTAVGMSALRLNISGSENTAVGYGALSANNGGGNTAIGKGALFINSTGGFNTAAGTAALQNSGGSYNAAVGSSALYSAMGNDNAALGSNALRLLATGSYNSAVGVAALANTTSATGNTAMGFEAGLNNVVGSYNTLVGFTAGKNLTGSYNLMLDSPGAAGDSFTIRIGSSHHTRAFMQGVRGVTTGVGDAVPVVIDSSGQLGTIVSSIRFKEDIHDLGADADRVLALRPVSFRYKKPFVNGQRPVQYGLIAEEVEKVFPGLVVYGKDGKPETVKYQDLPTLLLGELERTNARLKEERRRGDESQQKLVDAERRVTEQEAVIRELLLRVAALERRVAPGGSP